MSLLPGTEIDGALKVAGVMRKNLDALAIEHAGSSVSRQVTVSMGVSSVVPNQAVPPSRLIEAADQALYAAKDAGRDRIRAFPLDDPLPAVPTHKSKP